ncbi:hypothetical protein [Christiangramia sp.]|uniref:hypothetical protein n=1 Tax=Christiangramia sp. TaxID=1931228 RepID=UPI00260709C2|nr:hypothetical protein [Christiangramia sp.]
MVLFSIYLVILVSIARKIYDNLGVKADHPVDKEMLNLVEKDFIVTPSPNFRYSYSIMREGVVQHLDRDYTYDIVPKELENGILFQGIHRLPKGTSFLIELKKPATVYFIFHQSSDGGYSKIFPYLEGWQKCGLAPKYDISNGAHGLNMSMYKLDGKTGTYNINPSNEERGCVSIVFKLL